MKYQTISMKQFFPAKGAIYYVAIATVIFSHVKITCYFHMWRYHVFARKLTWYFIGVYIIRSFINSIDWFTQFTTINRLKSWRFRALALRQNESSQCSCQVFLSSTYKWIFRRPSKPLKHFDTLFKVKNVAKPADTTTKRFSERQHWEAALLQAGRVVCFNAAEEKPKLHNILEH